MKIRTIIGLLLVFALVLGSTGIGAAYDDADDNDLPDRDRIDWIDTDNDGIVDIPPGDGDGICNNP